MENPFQNFFKKTETSVIGIDIGSSALKVVQLRKKKGKAVLETYGELALGTYGGVTVGQAVSLPTDKLAEAVVDLLREAKVTTGNAGVSIPFRSSLVSLIEMPVSDERQLKEMIPIEARKYIPVPISEVTLDWWVIPKEESQDLDFIQKDEEHSLAQVAPSSNGPAAASGSWIGPLGGGSNNEKKPDHPDPPAAKKTEVLVVSIHNEVLTNFNNTVIKAGLKTSFFEIEMFSATRSLLSQETTPVMIFDMGAASTKIYIMDRGIIRSSHIINKGSQDLTISISKSLGVPIDKAEKIKRALGSGELGEERSIFDTISVPIDFIFSEANSVLLNYQRKYSKTISKVILTGGGSSLHGFSELARANFQTDVMIGDPFAKVEAPAFLEEVLKATGVDFSVAVGIALRKLQELN